MTAHDPSRIHWARLLKMITDTPKQTISVHQLARTLEVAYDHPPLKEAIDQLLTQGKIRKLMGRDEETKAMCVVLILTPEDTERGKRSHV